MDDIKVYRAFYIHPKTKEKIYVRNGKFYKTIGQCKTGLRTLDWQVPIESTRQYIIEEYVIKWTADVECAYIERKDKSWHVDVRYEKID